LILFTAAAASFSGFYEKWHFREAMPEYQTNSPSTGPKLPGVSLSLGAMLDGTASRPYVYRQLLPTIANSIDSVLPASVKEALYSFRTPSGKFLRERFFISPMARSHEYFVRYFIIYFSTFTFAILSTCGMFFFARSQGFNSTQSIAASAVMILLLPVFMSVGGLLLRLRGTGVSCRRSTYRPPLALGLADSPCGFSRLEQGVLPSFCSVFLPASAEQVFKMAVNSCHWSQWCGSGLGRRRIALTFRREFWWLSRISLGRADFIPIKSRKDDRAGGFDLRDY
jgi:hypothetical protein